MLRDYRSNFNAIIFQMMPVWKMEFSTCVTTHALCNVRLKWAKLVFYSKEMLLNRIANVVKKKKARSF